VSGNPFVLTYGTGGTYAGLDRFGRIVKQKWEIKGASPESILDRYEYAYDRMSSRKSRDVTPTSPPSGKDEYYVYDGLHRLEKYNRGDLAGGEIEDGDADFNQHWSELESLGNWRQFKWDSDGGADSWTTQSRKHNTANEIDNDDNHGNAPVDTITGTRQDELPVRMWLESKQ